MRLFVGLDLSPEVFDNVVRYIGEMTQMAPREKWARPDTLHVTLKFIGETKRADDIQRALENVKVPAFVIRVESVGFFTPQKPRVFWAGINAGSELAQLAQCIDLEVSQFGVAREKDPYRPHLTLARNGTGKPSGTPQDRKIPLMLDLMKHVETLPSPSFGTMTADAFFLYESRLLPEGAKYTKIARYNLDV